MMIYGWKRDEVLSPPGCAPLWAWIPRYEQMELVGGGMEVAYEVREGREAEAGRHVFSNQDRAECPVPCILQFSLEV